MQKIVKLIKILLCHNDAKIIGFFKKLDQKMNMQVTFVDEGGQAVDCSNKESFHCVFIDSKIAQNQGNKNLKLLNPSVAIFIIADEKEEFNLESFLNDGVSGVLYKPLEMDKINSTIQSLEAQRFFQSELKTAALGLKDSNEDCEVEEEAKKVSDLVKDAEEVELKRKK